ncbi:MAG: hypothetical protein JO020_17950 [Chloroflexi bacterium]|nr:hypothetical protein [Chloroflexota bacterium]
MKDGQLLILDHAPLKSTSVAIALLAGFVASVAMVLAFAAAYAAALVLSRLPVPVLADWFRGLTTNQLIDIAAPNLYAATAVFFVGGMVWALLYALVFDGRVNGSPLERGVKFALVPWLFSLLIFMPLVGGGLLGLSLGAGPLPILGNLVLHAVYGAVLGTVWGSAESVIDLPGRQAYSEDLQAGRLSELGAARGIGVGVALGLVVGLVSAALVPHGAMNPLAIVVAIALSGAAFGGFAGSFATR